jgi:hypothetical protein
MGLGVVANIDASWPEQSERLIEKFVFAGATIGKNEV